MLRADGLTPTAALPPKSQVPRPAPQVCELVRRGGIPSFDISRFMEHNKVTTLGIYGHLFADDYSDAMTAVAQWPAQNSLGATW